MTEQQPSPPIITTNETQPPTIIDSTPAKNTKATNEEQTSQTLREIQENAGQISELTAEEQTLVKDFFESLLKIMKPFGKTIEISATGLPESYSRRTNKAYLYLTGQLVLVFTNGEVEIMNLVDPENHQVLVDITGEIMGKLRTVINTHRSNTESRVKFLMQITKELQKVAQVFSEEH
jgi:hypothetical protein